MDKRNVVGALMVILGVAVLVILASFVVTVIVDLLKLVAVGVGILLILGGLAFLFGRRWMRKGWFESGPHPSST